MKALDQGAPAPSPIRPPLANPRRMAPSWPISGSAVLRIWMRHVRVFLQAWFVRIFTPLTEPIFYFIGFGFGMGAFVQNVTVHGESIPYLQYVAPGMVALSILYPPFLEASYGAFIRFRFSFTWSGFLSAPITFPDIVAAEILWAITKGALSGIATAVVAVLFGGFDYQYLPWIILPVLVGSFFTAALGFAAAAFTRHIDDINICMFLLVVPMFTFSGTFFPREMLPQPLQTIAEYFPFSAIVDLCRWSVGLHTGDPWLMAAIPLATGMVLVGLGYQRFHRRLFP